MPLTPLDLGLIVRSVQPDGSTEARALSSNILDAAPVAMALTDQDGVIRWANAALARLTQREVASLIGMRFADLSGRAAPLADSGPRDAERSWILPDGSIRWVAVDWTPAIDGAGAAITVDGVSCTITQVADITDIKEVRTELERSNRELTEFAYVASHDLSEPLRVIAGHVDLIARRYRGQLDDDAERWITFAVDGCTRMRQLINDMLEYSRYGRTQDKHHPVDLNDVVRRAIAGTLRGDEGVSPIIEVGELPRVLGAASELERVFANLLHNAARFVPPGVQSEVTIAASRHDDLWIVTVTDNGIGIAPEYRERVFGLFQRLNRQEDYAGTGIGLAICRKVVELHHGRIWVEAAPTGGSRFCIELPVLVHAF